MLLAVILALSCYAVTSSGQPTVIFSTPKDIRFAYLLRQSKANVIVKDLEGAGGLDFFYEKRIICWTDQKSEVIQCVHFNGTHAGSKVTVVTNGLATPDGLACDWLTDKLYWTESESKRIEVVSLDGKYKKVLFWDDIDQPRAIALVPTASIMFWSDWGEVPKIERGAMNGDPLSRKVIVSDGIFWPNGITVDYDANKVYWLDARLHFIESMDYDGKNRKKVLSEKGIRYPFALTLFKEKLYWTDWETWCVYTLDRSQPTHPKEFIDNPDQVPMDIRVMDPSRQPFKFTPCHDNNGGCSHLCLLSPNPPGYTCACPTGIKLIDKYTCANGPQELLLLVQMTEICMISLDSPDHTSVVLPLKGVKHGIAIDFDPVTKYLYWTDDEMDMIRRARLNGSGQEVLISTELQHPDGVAIDWRAQNMYWTDTGTDRIQVLRIGTSYTKVLINANLGEPRAIAVSPDEGFMFWSDWNEKWPKLERAALDGSQRSILVDTHLGWPNGIALDIPRRKVYWCDAKTDLIEVINYDGSDRREVITDNVPHVFGLTLVGDYLYWTDWQRRILDSAHKVTGEDRRVILDQQANMMGLKAVGPYLEPKTGNPCAVNNGNCAHLCLNTPNKYVCACQMGYELSTNGYSCVVPEAFILFTRKDNIGRISIENAHNDAIIPVSGIKEASALDFDIKDNRIYWTDIKAKCISRAFINGSNVEKIVEFGLETPEGLAVDWIAHNIYWTDMGTKRIEVALLDGNFRRAIIWSGLQEPKSIAVDPIQGFIYWSDWAGTGSLHRAHLDGSNPKLLIAKLGQANSLTIDLPEKVIYWCALQDGAIEAANLDGTKRRMITRSPFPFTMSLYQDKIYWFDWKTKDLYVTRKLPGSEKSILHSKNDQITSVVVYHGWGQTGWGICASRGNCPQLCLNKCICQTHYTLEGNKCITPSSFMLLSSKNSVSRLVFNGPDAPDAPIPVHGLKNVKALEYDPVHQVLFWIDGRTQSIRKWSLAYGGPSTTLQVGDYHPNSLALDPYSRVLFWSCASDGTINATKLDNGSTAVVVFRSLEMERPRFIRVHPLKGLLFWVAEGRETRIYTGRLDGKRRKTLISGLPTIYSFTVDYKRDSLYWLTFNAVEASNIEGQNRHELVSGLNQKFGSIAVMDKYLYVLNSRGVSSVEIETRKIKDIYSTSQHLTDLIAVSAPISVVDTSWYCQNGEKVNSYLDCSHLSTCTREQFACVSSEGDCIPLKWKCDALTDCFDGSDEANCPECGPNQFTCLSGHCIDIRFKCDGASQCHDNSDESNCCLASGGHQCDGKCLHSSSICDGWRHCSDGSDESTTACAAHHQSYGFHSSSHTHLIIIGFILATCLVIAAYAVYRCRMRKVKPGCGSVMVGDPVLDPLSPKPLRGGMKLPASVRISSLHRSSSSQPSTGSLLCYPLNPPPSPATTNKEMCSTLLYCPPPPTPCSTDVCHETDSNYQGDSEPLPPPPTPTSLSPSPSSSTYFHPTPPPPSPTP